jgi:hypothetical protein
MLTGMSLHIQILDSPSTIEIQATVKIKQCCELQLSMSGSVIVLGADWDCNTGGDGSWSSALSVALLLMAVTIKLCTITQKGLCHWWQDLASYFLWCVVLFLSVCGDVIPV